MDVWEYYTPEQQKKMTNNRKKFSLQELQTIRKEADELISKLREEVKKNTPTDDQLVVERAQRLKSLTDNFDEGDPEITKATERFYDENPDSEMHGMDAKLYKYYLKCLNES